MYNQSEKGGSKKWQGFSIVELLIVLAIIGIISSIIIPQVGGVLPNSKEVLAREFVEKLNRALKIMLKQITKLNIQKMILLQAMKF